MTVWKLAPWSGRWFLAGWLTAALFVALVPAEAYSAGAASSADDDTALIAADAATGAAAAPGDASPAEAAPADAEQASAQPTDGEKKKAPPLELDLRVRLSILHFLEFAIWGSWWVVLGQYLEGLHFTRKAVGNTYATMALGSIIAPLFVGAIADRYFAAQHVMALLQLVGAVLLFGLARITKQRAFYWVTLLYALIFAPTIMLVNPLTFAHLADGERDFPSLRLFGSIGWILVNFAIKLFVKPGQPMNNRPILLAGALSVVLGIYSFSLPETPPNPDAPAIPFLEAMALLKEPSAAVFFGISFVIAVGLAFYFSFTGIFLEKKVGVRSDNVGPLMTIGQWVELPLMFTLPWFLGEFGMKWVLVMGMAAWALRYGCFAIGKPLALIILGIALHGACFDFFFGAGFIHVANIAPSIPASSQALFAVVTYGLGMYLGTEASGWLNQYLTREVVDSKTGTSERVTNWRLFWLIPGVAILVSVLLFVRLFDAPVGGPAPPPVEPTSGAAPAIDAP